MQLGPQKLTITGRPRSDARSNVAPSRVVPWIGGAGRPRPKPEPTVDSEARSHAAPRTMARVAMAARPTATRIGRRRGSMRRTVADLPAEGYWTVSVPVMSGIGWILQMKVYVPAGSGWYW
jgi:hypothetical protein